MSTEWEQQLLVQPAAVEVRIRMGFVPERSHAQVMVEAFDPATRAQLSMWSRGHVHMADWPQALEEAVQRAQQTIENYVTPF